MAALPAFDAQGLLPAGDYELTFDELRRSRLVAGPAGPDSTWDTEWRKTLVDNLEVMTRQLWQVGIREVFADGSFVEEKDRPNDIDGYFVCALAEFGQRGTRSEVRTSSIRIKFGRGILGLGRLIRGYLSRSGP